MTGILNALIAGVSGAVKDTYFNLVSLLLPGNGTNGATNNSFVDSSTANSGTGWPITRNGDTTQGTFSPFSQTGWGNYFDGTGDSLSIADNAAFSYGTVDFTIETWVYPAGLGTTRRLYFHQTTSTTQLTIYQLNTNYVGFFVSSGGTTLIDILSNTLLPGNAWSHIAVVRNGNSFVIYQNGVSVASTTSSATMPDPTGPLYIGALDTGSDSWLGYLSNYRIVKGTAVYTGAFTPPTSPLTAISGTSLLTCQSNRFKDSSSTPLTVTPSGNTSVTPFSPFAPTSSYSAAAVGGSGYFDGSGDFLTAADNAAFDLPGDFTIEMWVYASASPGGTKSFINHSDAASTGWALGFNGTGTNLFWYTNSSFILNTSSGLVLNAWNHVAAVRSGTSLVIYINGTSAGSVTNSTSYAGTGLLYVGSDQYNQSFVGTLSGVRIVKGQALASGNFTPPSAPVTTSTVGWTGANAAGSLTGTVSLLLNFTNAGVVDATAKNVLETEGNAQISTAQSKWGGGSIYFNGSSSYLMSAANQAYELGSGDFTIECWVNISAAASDAGIVGKGPVGSINNSIWSIEFVGTGNTIGFYAPAASASFIITGTTNIKSSTWTHIAVSRSGNNTRLFVNGTQEGSTYTSGYTITTGNNLYVGGGFYAPTTRTITGYVDDLRITKYGRYTANFTPPTAPFPLQ
jgi:hypothetical protein